MDIVVRGSEYQDYLQCRKKWFHGWVEKITPKRPDGKLFFGSLFHKWLEGYYKSGFHIPTADIETREWIENQDTTGMVDGEYDKMMDLYRGVRQNYIDTYHEEDKQWTILGTEVEFLVKLQEGTYMTGTIDLVYEVDGKIRFADHKCVASLDMYEEKSKMDRQISRYWWALDMIAAGIGRIKDKQNNVWVHWTKLEGKEIDGFTYNLIAKDFPREVKMLKSGKPSTDKSQKTTYAKYIGKIEELELNPLDYGDILEILHNKPDPFLRRINVIRTQKELESAVWEFLYTCNDMHDTGVTLVHYPEKLEEVTYRHIGQHCDHMCQFKAICQADIAGDNVQLVKNLSYKKNEERG